MGVAALSNSDKHRLGAIPTADLGLPVTQGPFWSDLKSMDQNWVFGPYEDGAVVATYRVQVTGPDPNVEVKFKPTFYVTIDEGVDREPRHLGLVIPAITSAVESTVARLAPLFSS